MSHLPKQGETPLEDEEFGDDQSIHHDKKHNNPFVRYVLHMLGTKQRILRKEKKIGKENSSQRKRCKESKEKYC